jgi:hypothetical protein
MYRSKFHETLLCFDRFFELSELSQLQIPIPHTRILLIKDFNYRTTIGTTNLFAEQIPLTQLLSVRL